MTRAEARTAAKGSTDHDNDDQASEALIDTWVDSEYRRVRREIAMVVPQLYTATGSNQVIANGTTTITKPVLFERLIRIERLATGSTTRWYPVAISDELSPHISAVVNAREEGSTFELDPSDRTEGTYRIVYIFGVAAMPAVGTSRDTDALVIPEGFEDVITERAAARIRIKTDDDPSPHLSLAEKVWKDNLHILKRRYGNHITPGIRRVRASIGRRW